MSKYRDELILGVPLSDATLACQEAVAVTNWGIVEYGDRVILCKELFSILSFTNPAKVEISLHEVRSDVTQVVMKASNFGWGPIQSSHLRNRVDKLRDRIEVAAAKFNGGRFLLEEHHKTCRRCGSGNDAESKFCTTCGTSLAQ